MTDQLTPARRAAPRRRGVSPITWLGVLLVATGLALLGWFAYQAYWEPVVDEAGQQQQIDQLKKEWSTPGTGSASGAIPEHAFALIRIPDIGRGYEVPVVTGTTPYSLSVGVGWFDGTAEPGQIGNFALAGHRGRSGPFVQVPDLNPGAQIIVETRDAIYTYELTNKPRELVVDKHETWVLDPVPRHPGQKPTKALITLVTCANFFHSPERSIAFGELVETVKK